MKRSTNRLKLENWDLILIKILKWKRLILQVCTCRFWQSLQISSSEARQLVHKKHLCLSSWGSAPVRWQFGAHMTAATDELGSSGEWILVILQNSINLKYTNLKLQTLLHFKAQVHLQHYINTGGSLNKTKRHCREQAFRCSVHQDLNWGFLNL